MKQGTQKVLVVGASGFIGQYVCELLKDYQLLKYQGNALHEDWHEYMQRERPQYLINLAWRTGAGYLEAYENVLFLKSGLEMYDAFYAAGGKRAVFVGTEQEYKRTDHPVREKDEIAPISLYAKCKADLGDVLVRVSENEGNGFVWCRLFFIYGPGEKSARLMPSIINGIMNGEEVVCSYGGYVRDYIYVKDVASAIVRCLFSDYTGVVNVAGGKETTIRQIGEIIEKKLDAKTKIKYKTKEESGNQPEYIVADISVLKSLGWERAFSLEKGLEEEIKYLKDNR